MNRHFDFNENIYIFVGIIFLTEMRRNWIDSIRMILSISAISLFASCQIDIQDFGGGDDRCTHEVGIYAGGASTRTEMLSNGLSAAWTAGDNIALWAKSSSGSYVLSNQIFTTYGIDSSRGFFKSDLSSTMSDGEYTYYCCYPAPSSVNGTEVTFDLPSVQDGKASGGVDIMIANPVKHGPLSGIPDPEDHSGLSMQMNRMMHHFRFFIPADNTAIGRDKLERILLTFPSGVTGKVTCDLSKPGTAPVLSEAKASAELRLAEPIGISGSDYQYAYFVFAPQKFSAGQKLQVKAYTDDKIAYFDDIDLCARDFKAGHSTPVKLKVREITEYPYTITFKVALNNLGEEPDKIVLTAPSGCIWDDSGSNVYTYEPGHKIARYETFSIRFEDEQQYKAFSSKDISVVYDSEHAITYQTVRVQDLSSISSTEIPLTVPYLFYEDFNGIPSFSDGHDNPSVGGKSDTWTGMNDLSVYTSQLAGWNAARAGGENGAIRICCRYENVLGGCAYYKGRLYSPYMTSIKDGKDVNITVSFKYGTARNERDPLIGGPPKKNSLLFFGINTLDPLINEDDTDLISGVITGGGYGNQRPASLSPVVINGEEMSATDGSYTKFTGTKTVTINRVDNYMRMAWILSTTNTSSNTNGNYWLYLDDIKVQIAN